MQLLSPSPIRLLAGLLLLLCLALLMVPTGCGGSDECLVDGENCSTTYKEANYGTTDIYCCSGLSCTDNSLGDSVCH